MVKKLAIAFLLWFVLLTPGQAETLAGSLNWGGMVRTYRLHLPPAPAKPMPLLIALHGLGGTGVSMENITFGGFNTRADRDGFAVVYPDGIEQHWNEGLATGQYFAHGIDADDVGFIAALIDLLAKERHIDRKRVYVTGVSNGATMAHRLACELGGKITAIAPVAGNMPTYLASRCAPCGPVSVLLINGTADPIVPWGGGEIEVDRLKLGMVLSVDETAKFWVNHNHCGTTPVLTQEPDGGRVRREVYSGGRGGSEVILYAIEGGGHTWPHAHRFLPEFLTGKTSLDANEVIWNFFKKHSMN